MPFIVIEGLDGAGKSTQVAMLAGKLGSAGKEIEYLHFPRFDAPVYGDLIARFLRGELGSVDAVDPHLVALIFAGDRLEAAPVIGRWLAAGKFVITDRYVYSNVAYQCAKVKDAASREALRKWILDLEFGYNDIPRPDISIFLDVPFRFTESKLMSARDGGDRNYLNGAQDIHEQSLELQKSVREMYLSCAQSDGSLHIVDCSDGSGGMDTPENIAARIAKIAAPYI